MDNDSAWSISSFDEDGDVDVDDDDNEEFFPPTKSCKSIIHLCLTASSAPQSKNAISTNIKHSRYIKFLVNPLPYLKAVCT